MGSEPIQEYRDLFLFKEQILGRHVHDLYV